MSEGAVRVAYVGEGSVVVCGVAGCGKSGAHQVVVDGTQVASFCGKHARVLMGELDQALAEERRQRFEPHRGPKRSG